MAEEAAGLPCWFPSSPPWPGALQDACALLPSAPALPTFPTSSMVPGGPCARRVGPAARAPCRCHQCLRQHSENGFHKEGEPLALLNCVSSRLYSFLWDRWSMLWQYTCWVRDTSTCSQISSIVRASCCWCRCAASCREETLGLRLGAQMLATSTVRCWSLCSRRASRRRACDPLQTAWWTVISLQPRCRHVSYTLTEIAALNAVSRLFQCNQS